MVDTGYIEATNKIVLAGHRSSVEKEVEEAGMKPGMLVKRGSSDNEVLKGTEATVNYGWLGYEDSPAMWKPKDIDTAYAVNARAAVINGPGMVLRAIRKASETVIMGDKLVGDADGELKKWVPVHDTDAADGTTQEMVVAMALEAGTGASDTLIVRSLI